MGSSTLCTVAVGTNNKVYFYNIGDSGLYILRYGVPPVKNGAAASSTKEWFIRDYTPKQFFQQHLNAALLLNPT